MPEFVQVTFTIDDEAEAKRLALSIVEARLGACAQVAGPILSTYWWAGEIDQATEWFCHVKTTADRFDALEAHIVEHHPYDAPEIISTPITHGSPTYLAWIQAETHAT